jgi:phosphatidylglycerophosphatase A
MATTGGARLGLPFHHPATLIGTWFGSGFLPGAPGSWGSLAALPFAWVIGSGFGAMGLVVAAAGLFPLGWWAAERLCRASGREDPGAIVVDEVVGLWVTLAFVPVRPAPYLLGFLLFRIADIVKPWPASWADRAIEGGLGIIADDVIAGLYAGIAALAALHLLGW